MSAIQQVLMDVAGSGGPSGPHVLDAFARADAATLGTADTGQLWHVTQNAGTGVAGIDGGRAYANAGTGNALVLAYLDSGVAAQDISMQFDVIGGYPRYSGIVANYLNLSNYVVLQLEANASTPASYGLYVQISGVYSNIGNSTVAPSDGDIVRLKETPTTLDFWVNGAHFGPFSNPSSAPMLASTLCGFQSGSVSGNPSSARFGPFAVQ